MFSNYVQSPFFPLPLFSGLDLYIIRKHLVFPQIS